MLAAYTTRGLPSARSSPLMGPKQLPCWRALRPVGLERKILPQEATHFPGGSCGGWAIPSDGSRRERMRGHQFAMFRGGGSKLGRAQRL